MPDPEFDPAFFRVGKAAEADGCIPEFYLRSCYCGNKHIPGPNDERGRPTEIRTDEEIWEDREYVKIIIPASKDHVDRQVTPDDIQRWPERYAAFKKGQEMPVEGFPLSRWEAIGPTEVKNLNSFGIKTVQQLASISDANLPGMFKGAARLKRMAVEFLQEQTSTDSLRDRIEELEAAAAGVDDSKLKELEAENKRLKKENANQRKDMSSVMQRLEALEKSGDTQAA